MKINNHRSGTQVIQRSAVLLRLIASHNRSGMRLIDLYTLAQLTRPTAHRILQALVAEGFIRQNEKSKRYHLGTLIYEMGVTAAPIRELRDVCQPFLEHLAQVTGDTVFLTVRSGLDGVCLARSEGAAAMKAFVLDIGRRRPLNIGGGALAILSSLKNDEIERIWLANKERIQQGYADFDLRSMWRKIQQARTERYLISDVVEFKGIRTIAVPIVDAAARPVGALSISALRERLSDAMVTAKVAYLQDAISEVQACLQTP